MLFQNPSPHHLLPRASVSPGFADLSSLFALPPCWSMQCQVQKVPDSAPSSELFPAAAAPPCQGFNCQIPAFLRTARQKAADGADLSQSLVLPGRLFSVIFSPCCCLHSALTSSAVLPITFPQPEPS